MNGVQNSDLFNYIPLRQGYITSSDLDYLFYKSLFILIDLTEKTSYFLFNGLNGQQSNLHTFKNEFQPTTQAMGR